MNTDLFIYALLGALAIALAFSFYTDIKRRLIYNKVTATIALSAPLYWIATGDFTLSTIGTQLLLAFGIFIFFAIFFYMGMMGGGDLKLFTALALWFSWEITLRLILVASILGIFVTLVFMVSHKLQKREGPPRIPYGVAITIAGLLTVVERIFYHFA